MAVSRERLYKEVWARPMAVIAAEYGLSANYLARVCGHLNVPHPPRGYWAKLRVGKAPKPPNLPDPRAGEVLQWTKGDSVPRPARPMSTAKPAQSIDGARERPSRHELTVGVYESFETGYVSEVGYLRPRKRNLADVLVSRGTLPNALTAASELFLTLEDHGHRVVLSSDVALSHRPELALYEGQKFDYYNRQPWVPGRPTLVFVGQIAFGLSLYELTEHVEVKYDWNGPVRYVRVTKADSKRKAAWEFPSAPHKEHMPCGRLGLRVYAPYGGVEWQRRWVETTAGDLLEKCESIAKELKRAVPEVAKLRAEAKAKAEVERQRWEAARREREEAERQRRHAEAIERSRETLLEIVEAWSLARSIEGFFDDVITRAAALTSKEGPQLLSRVEEARKLLGDTGALERFRGWKAPIDR